jgi:hypothetical protein
MSATSVRVVVLAVEAVSTLLDPTHVSVHWVHNWVSINGHVKPAPQDDGVPAVGTTVDVQSVHRAMSLPAARAAKTLAGPAVTVMLMSTSAETLPESAVQTPSVGT